MTKILAKIIVLSLLATAAISCATIPEKAPIIRKG